MATEIRFDAPSAGMRRISRGVLIVTIVFTCGVLAGGLAGRLTAPASNAQETAKHAIPTSPVQTITPSHGPAQLTGYAALKVRVYEALARREADHGPICPPPRLVQATHRSSLEPRAGCSGFSRP